MNEENTTNTNSGAQDENQVYIYSTPTCHWCHVAKDWMDENGVKYTNYDVSTDHDKYEEMFAMTMQRGVPVIRVGNEVMIGFQKDRLKELVSNK